METHRDDEHSLVRTVPSPRAKGSSSIAMNEATTAARLQEILAVMRDLAEGKLGARVPRPADSGSGETPPPAIDEISVVLNELGEQLQTAVVRREQHEAAVRELEQAQLQLLHSAKLASLGELASGVAHELTQPLQIIGLSVDEINDALESGDRKTVTESLGIIEGQIARSAGVIGRLLAFSRADDGTDRPRTRLNETITQAVGIWGAQLAALGIELSTDLSLALDDVACAHNELLQVITNLVINARDAVMDREEHRICLRTIAGDGVVHIEVIDTGRGIDPSDLPRVFDPFFTTKPQGKGMGLGLSVSHGIIRRHGGTIEVSSELDQGTCMRVTLPVVEDS